MQMNHNPFKVLTFGDHVCLLGVASSYCQNPGVGTVKGARGALSKYPPTEGT